MTRLSLIKFSAALVVFSLSGCFDSSSSTRSGDGNIQRLPLNDTGAISYTQTFGSSTTDPLVENLLTTIPDVTAVGQDADLGNDVSNNNSLDGKAGFKFTKLDENGAPLSNQFAIYSETPWHCVKDQVTGLIWEVKTRSGLRRMDYTYTWYEPDSSLNGSFAGTQNDFSRCDLNIMPSCDSHSYKQAVNALNNGTGLCGMNNWRLPTREELRSIVDYGSNSGFAIDTNFFPNTLNSDTWTSQTAYYEVNDGTEAWEIHFDNGISESHAKTSKIAIRLVHTP